MRKRHSQVEIAALLSQAREMTSQGRLQGDIAKALGISVMTYHRWRKAQEGNRSAPSRAAAHPAEPGTQTNPISELRLENLRLRRLVADLLLEKMSLEEALGSKGAAQRMTGRG